MTDSGPPAEIVIFEPPRSRARGDRRQARRPQPVPQTMAVRVIAQDPTVKADG